MSKFDDIFKKLTEQQATTIPSISMPASANAVLAAMEAEATQLSRPSFSITVMKTSMVDLGKR